MTFFHALILGIVEGITEFLPVSSTGHLILTSHLLGLPSTEFLKTFEIVIQLGAILAIVVLYFKTLTTSIDVWKRIIAAFIPTAFLGLIFYKLIKQFLGSETIVLWSLFIGGIFLIAFERWYGTKAPRESGTMNEKEIARLPLRKAVVIGLFQSVAMIPGVSRSAATIVGGLFLGMSRGAIVEFSFLLALPTMAAATGLDLLKHANNFTGADFGLLIVGLATSFLVAMVTVKTFVRFVERHTFTSFGVYRIVLVLLFLVFLSFNGSAPDTAPEDAPALYDYKNITYRIDGRMVALVNGVAESEAAPGSASKVTTRYFGNEANGDLNGDGITDVAFLVTEDGGGSGTFYYVVAALKTSVGYTGTNAVLLGDRIAPETTTISDGDIIVNYADRKPEQAMAFPPSIGVSKYLRVSDGELTVIK